MLVGIAAYNEEKNIGGLLSVLTGEEYVDQIVVVSSSTDRTNEIVQEHAKSKDPRVRLVPEIDRRGKSSAANVILEHAEAGGFDIIVYMGADNIPLAGSLKVLVSEFDNERVGVVGGKPEPVDKPSTFSGWTSHLQWNMHHVISETSEPKVSGELMAFRVGVVREIPIAIINDDAYIQLMAEEKGYDIKYAPSAVVKLKGCCTTADIVRQRRRVYLGHLQVLFLTGTKLSTFKWRSYHRVLRASLPSFGPRQVCYLIGAVALQAWAYLLALTDFHLFRLPYKWKIAETTKESIVIASSEQNHSV